MCESRRNYLQGVNGGKSKPVGAVSPDGHKVIDFESPTASTSSSEGGNGGGGGNGTSENNATPTSSGVVGTSKHSLKLSPQVS